MTPARGRAAHSRMSGGMQERQAGIVLNGEP
jgi:hypothetical protein